ncbi:hypothetical protein BJX64DRAFT_265094 [Aspergillus heterothallicus]
MIIALALNPIASPTVRAMTRRIATRSGLVDLQASPCSSCPIHFSLFSTSELTLMRATLTCLVGLLTMLSTMLRLPDSFHAVEHLGSGIDENHVELLGRFIKQSNHHDKAAQSQEALYPPLESYNPGDDHPA